MNPEPSDLRTKATVLALSEVRGVGKPFHLAQLLEEVGPDALLAGQHSPDYEGAELVARFGSCDPRRIDYWESELASLAAQGITLRTVLDHDYPINLRMIFNRPPFVFVWGDLRSSDSRAVAVVGTRRPSDEGRRIATEIAQGLAEQNVTVVSGLALGIDVAAHAAALGAGGRTIAVFGSGITKVAPSSHRAIAKQIRTSGRGALISQFLPATPPQRWTFPERNVVTSGLSIGSVIVEAGETSGARIQARQCLEHGKRLFLLDRLVTKQDWARDMAAQPGASVVTTVSEVLEGVARELSPTAQDIPLLR